MNNTECIIGIDSSTTATKAIAFLPDGTVASEGVSRYSYDVRYPGWAEQDAGEWWRALCSACRELTSGLDRSIDIRGVAITHQRFSFVAVDSSMEPLYPAILWNDTRCAAESEYARRERNPGYIFERTGYPPGQWTLYKMMWLRDHEPEVYNKIHRVLLVPDFLSFHLTGKLATSASSAAMTGALDIANRHRWATDIIESLNIRPDVWVEPIVGGGEDVGRVTPRAADKTGLPKGIPVFAAAGDQPCGSLAAGVLEKGLLGVNGGTSCSNEFFVDILPPRKESSYFVEISPAGGYIVENDIPSGGSAVTNWYKDNFAEESVRSAEDPWNKIYENLDTTVPGNGGLMLVPYLQAVYGPYWNQNARAVMVGLHRDHNRASLVRALLEGVAYEAKREASLMSNATGVPVREIRMYGGSAANPRWNQLFADVFGIPVKVPRTTEATALGAAMCAAVGAGIHQTFPDAVAAMTEMASIFQPVPKHAHLYQRYFDEVYSGLYDKLGDVDNTVAAINRDVGGFDV